MRRDQRRLDGIGERGEVAVGWIRHKPERFRWHHPTNYETAGQFFLGCDPAVTFRGGDFRGEP